MDYEDQICFPLKCTCRVLVDQIIRDSFGSINKHTYMLLEPKYKLFLANLETYELVFCAKVWIIAVGNSCSFDKIKRGESVVLSLEH